MRYSAIDLLGTLGCTDDKLSKMLMLEKCKFIPLMAKLLKQLKDDVPLRILITRAINNFIISNTQMLLSDNDLLEELVSYIEVAVDEPGKCSSEQLHLAQRSLFVMKTALYLAHIGQK